ncbi:MAG: hypothetical protein AAF541_24000 [Pseudomonadota bacterium]
MSRMQQETFTAYRERYGLTKALLRIVLKRVNNRFFFAYVTARDMGGEVSAPKPGFDIRVATEAELLMAANEIPALSSEEIKHALANGDVCLAAFHSDRLVAFTWRCYNKTRHTPGIWVETQKPFRYGYKAYTLPDYRGQHLLKPQYTDAICKSKGYAVATGFIELHNYASIRNSRRNGNRTVGFAGYFRILGKHYTFRTPGAKKFGFRFVAVDEEIAG